MDTLQTRWQDLEHAAPSGDSIEDYAAFLSTRSEFIELTHDSIIVRDLGGRILFWNRGAEEMYGWSRAEAVGHTTHELLKTEFPIPLQEIIGQIERLGHWDGELIHTRKDGTAIVVSSRWAVTHGGEGTGLGILEMNDDVTEQQRTRTELQYQAALLANVSDAIISTDTEFRIQSWNRAAEEIYGWSAQEAIGKFSSQLLQPVYLGVTRDEIVQTLKREGKWRGESFQQRRDGSAVPILGSVAALYDAKGTWVGWVTANRDISALKSVEKQIQDNAARNQALAEISKVLASVSTDYKGVLSTLVEQVTDLIGDRVGLALVSPDHQSLDIVDMQGIEPEMVEIVRELIPSGRFPLNQIPDWQTLERGEAIFVPVVDQDAVRARTKPEYIQYLDRFGTFSQLTVPMRVQGTVIGALGVSRARPDQPYTVADKGFLQEIADRAALAITNAQLLETVQAALALRSKAEEEVRTLNAELEARVAERTIQLVETNAQLVNEISERAHAEELLAHERDLLHALMDNITDTIYFKDTESRFIRVNIAAARVIGIDSPEDAVGKTDLDWQPKELADSFLAEEREIMEKKEPLIDRIEYNPMRDGTPRWFSASKAPIIDKDGKVTGTAGISRDITSRVIAEQQVQRLNKELEQRAMELEVANKELEAFSYSVSHDLRAPLRAIDGYSRILLEDYDALLDDEGRRVSSVIRNEAQRMSQLIDDLLELSRLGRREMQHTQIDMTQMARNVYAELTGSENGGKVNFTVGALPADYGDPILLRQVWINLLSNAIKFTSKRECPEIQVEGSQTETESIYWVRDNGAGFDVKYYNKLFGVFQRLHNDREFGGTGVGLAIVQRAVRRHGGRVWAEGQVNQGATFYFALPRSGENQ